MFLRLYLLILLCALTEPVLVDTGMTTRCVRWSPVGGVLAVAGMDKRTSENLVQLYTPLGQVRFVCVCACVFRLCGRCVLSTRGVLLLHCSSYLIVSTRLHATSQHSIFTHCMCPGHN